MESKPINEWLEIRTSKVHGRGVFSRQQIPAGMRLIEYSGERIAKEESTRRCAAGNVFIIALDDQTDLDGASETNLARFINHSCEPNCEAVIEEEVTLLIAEAPPTDGQPPELEGTTSESHIYIDAVRDLLPGEEVTFNYGYDLVDYENHPCRCGAPSCVGFMVADELIPELRQHLARRRGCEGSSNPASA